MKKTVIFLFAATLFACILSLYAFAETIASGYCGDLEVNNGQNVTWALDDEGTLTISGNGDMGNFSRIPNIVDVSDLFNGDLFAPDTTNSNVLNHTDSLVYDVPWYSFKKSIIKVNISSSVTRIGDYAFSSCDLTSIIIGDSVKSIGVFAFSFCNNLTSIKIPDSVIRIGDYAFSSSGLTSITIGNSVTSIGDAAFNGCSNLTSIIIGDSVKSIGVFAFSFCNNLTSIKIPDSVIRIGDYAFNGCSNLTSITIGDSVTIIGGLTFAYCISLSDIYYTGTEEQWDAISKGIDWDHQTGSDVGGYTVHFNYVPSCSLAPAAASYENGVHTFAVNVKNEYPEEKHVEIYAAIYDESGRFAGIQKQTVILPAFGNANADFSLRGAENALIKVFLLDAFLAPLSDSVEIS